MKNLTPTIDSIDEVLPQTQCGLCDYAGCRPYATAIIEKKAAINQCPPGGIETLLALAQQLSMDPTPFLTEMEQKKKPMTRAVIREEACIGCTKCIQACPTDAIIGAGKKMHTVITDACTGCGLCLAPCPVDCIEMVATEKPLQPHQSKNWRTRYQERNARLARLKDKEKSEKEAIKQQLLSKETKASRQLAVLAAAQRARKKRALHE